MKKGMKECVALPKAYCIRVFTLSFVFILQNHASVDVYGSPCTWWSVKKGDCVPVQNRVRID